MPLQNTICQMQLGPCGWDPLICEGDCCSYLMQAEPSIPACAITQGMTGTCILSLRRIKLTKKQIPLATIVQAWNRRAQGRMLQVRAVQHMLANFSARFCTYSHVQHMFNTCSTHVQHMFNTCSTCVCFLFSFFARFFPGPWPPPCRSPRRPRASKRPWAGGAPSCARSCARTWCGWRRGSRRWRSAWTWKARMEGRVPVEGGRTS